MQNQKGFNKNQTTEVLINSFIFVIPMAMFYMQGNKLLAALAAMAAFFNLYSISLSKSDVKSTIVGSYVSNVLIASFIIYHYFNNSDWILFSIWLLITIWFIYKLKGKITS
jgi:Flp pilus assembly protein protease CpaA